MPAGEAVIPTVQLFLRGLSSENAKTTGGLLAVVSDWVWEILGLTVVNFKDLQQAVMKLLAVDRTS